MADDSLEIRTFTTLESLSDHAESLTGVITESLGVRQSLEKTLDQIDFGEGSSVIVTGWIDNELATMNAFIRHSFISCSAEVYGYQSGFSASANAFRGKGLWPKLLLRSEEVVAQLGGSWIFGFPNPVSHPLFEKKLGYQTLFLTKTYFPALGSRLFVNLEQDDQGFAPNVSELIEWKIRAAIEGLVISDLDGACGFGIRRKTHGAAYLEIGALDPGDHQPRNLIQDLCKKAGVHIASFEANTPYQHPVISPFKKKTRPAIVKAIGGKALPNKIHFPSGLSDTF
jgi:hypothetical protein